MKGLPLLVTLVAVVGCQEKHVKSALPASPLSTLSPAALQKLSQSRVYFGHQSVGQNLVEGLDALGRERPELRLRIVMSRAPEALATPGLAHAGNGKNHEPLTKVQDFSATLEGGGLGERVDVAFFKFCYVDFAAGADVEQVFAEYRATMARLRQRFPKVRFVHVTVPLTVVRGGLKVWLNSLRGKAPWGAEANVARERFNALLRKEFAGKEPLFDLAAVESTRPDGTIQTFRLAGEDHPSLAPEYSSDGNHLNDAGARWAASHLVAELARAVQ